MKKVNFFNEIVFSIIIEPLSSISKMLRFVFIFSLLVLSSPSYVLSMFEETSAEPSYHGVFTKRIYEQESAGDPRQLEQEKNEACVRALQVNKQEALKNSIINRLRRKIEIITQERDNDRKRVFWDTLIGNTSMLPLALTKCTCPQDTIGVIAGTALRVVASGIVSSFYDPPIVEALTKEIALINDEIDFLFSGLERERVYEYEVQYVKKKRNLSPILQTELEDALIEARTPTVVYPAIQAFLKYGLLLPTAPKPLLGHNPQEDYLVLCRKFEEDPFFAGFSEKTRSSLKSLMKSVVDASIAEESSSIPLRIRCFFWGNPGSGKSAAAIRLPKFLGLPYFEISIRSPEELSRENLEGVTRMRSDVNLGWLVSPLIAKLEDVPDETYSNAFLIINDFHNVLFNPQSGRAALAFLLDYLDPEKKDIPHNYFRAPINIRRMNIIITSNKPIPKGSGSQAAIPGENLRRQGLSSIFEKGIQKIFSRLLSLLGLQLTAGIARSQEETYVALPSRVQEIEFSDLEEEKQEAILRGHLEELHRHNHFANWIRISLEGGQLIISSILLNDQNPVSLQVIDLAKHPLMDRTNIRTRKRSIEIIMSSMSSQMVELADKKYRDAQSRFSSNNGDEQAIQLCKEAAQEGKIEAAYHLGIVYRTLDQREQSKFFFKKAYENNHLAAACELGKILLEEGNRPEAKICFKLAAGKGDGECADRLGQLYQEESNIAEAEQYYKKAVDLRYISAKYHLALLYITQRKYMEAKALYLELIRANLLVPQASEGLYALSRLFEERDGIFSPSNICASECLREAVAQGHLLAHVKVAMLPFWKRSISFDRNEIASLRFAVNSGNPLALNILGFLHQYGIGVEKNIPLALNHYNEAKRECLIAKYNLACIYFFGLSDVVKNEQLAITYISEIYRILSPITNENQLKTFAYSRFSPEPFGTHAIYAHIIGAMYHYGWGYPQDSRQAMMWFQLAAGTGYISAQTSLMNIRNTECSIQSGCSIQ